jgi:hypothetical protein
VSHNINLFNPALRPPRVVLPGVQMLLLWLVALGIAVAGSVWAVGSRNATRAEQQALAERQEQLAADVKRLGTELAARSASPELRAALAQREALLQSREEVLQLLQSGALGDTAGHARYLRAFARQHRDGLWLTGLTVTGAGNDIVVQGRTLDPELVPAYLKRLGAEDSLKGHPFNRLQMGRPEAGAEAAGSRGSPPPWIEFLVATEAGSGAPPTGSVGSSPAGSPQ